MLLNPRVWAVLLSCAFLTFSHYSMYRYGKGVVRNEWNAEKLAVAQEVRRLEQARTSAVINATAAQARREGAIVAESRSANAELQRLRDALASRDHGASSCPAADDRAATAEKLLVRSGELLTRIAESCDRQVNDKRALLEAWPK